MMKLAWLALVVVSVGCGKDEDPPPTGPQTIGPEGGAVESDDGILRLDVPAGAVAEETVFEVILVPQAEWPAKVAELSPVGEVYDVQPDGTVFAVPAVLTWTFETSPSGARDGEGNPFLLFGGSLSAADEVEISESTATRIDSAGAVVTNEISHLSSKFLTPAFLTTGEPVASIQAELNGGLHFVDNPWFAIEIVANPLDISSVFLRTNQLAGGVVTTLDSPGWVAGSHTESDEWSPGVSSALSSMPKWVCSSPGAGDITLKYAADVLLGFGILREASLEFTEAVTCVTREEKVEWLEHLAALIDRFESLGIAASAIKDLATAQGLYGYIVHFDEVPGPSVGAQTLEVCVSSSGSTAITYFPHFSPGFTFVDTTPGCTNITNADPSLPNDVLVELSGTGTVTTTTRILP